MGERDLGQHWGPGAVVPWPDLHAVAVGCQDSGDLLNSHNSSVCLVKQTQTGDHKSLIRGNR